MPPPIKRPSASASLKRPAAAAAAAAAASSSSSSSSGSPVTLEVYYEGKTCRIFNVTDKTAANIFERVAKQVGLAADQLEIQYEDKGNWIQYDGGSSQDPALQDIKTWTLKANRKDSGEPQPKKMRDSQVLSEVNLNLPPSDLKLVPNKFLQVDAFEQFLAPGTFESDPLFLRTHLMQVHDAVVQELTGTPTRLVSLVGCPGVGKTWCGQLVAYTLRNKGTSVLHVAVQDTVVTAVTEQKRRQFSIEIVLDLHAFKDLVESSSCQVCILDLSVRSDNAVEICEVMRGILQISCVKFMCLVSGHGEENIIGKRPDSSKTKSFVMWSWTEADVMKMLGSKSEEEARACFLVCGGSVRYLKDPSEDKRHILKTVGQMTPEQVTDFLSGSRPFSDVGSKQFTRLLAFYAKRGESEESFSQGITGAEFLPRSAAVLEELGKQAQSASKRTWGRVYHHLRQRNPGAAGTAFEMLVHLFWKTCISSGTEVHLQLTDQHEVTTSVQVKCASLGYSGSVNIKEALSTTSNGYFTPESSSQKVFDSMLRWTSGDKVEVFFIQVSIGKSHGVAHGPKSMTGSTTGNLALWDYPPGQKTCQWTGSDMGWTLYKIQCRQFHDFVYELVL